MAMDKEDKEKVKDREEIQQLINLLKKKQGIYGSSQVLLLSEQERSFHIAFAQAYIDALEMVKEGRDVNRCFAETLKGAKRVFNMEIGDVKAS